MIYLYDVFLPAISVPFFWAFWVLLVIILICIFIDLFIIKPINIKEIFDSFAMIGFLVFLNLIIPSSDQIKQMRQHYCDNHVCINQEDSKDGK